MSPGWWSGVAACLFAVALAAPPQHERLQLAALSAGLTLALRHVVDSEEDPS